MVVNFNRDSYNTGLLLPTKLEKLKEGYQIGPLWLRPLLTAKFFDTCEVHGDNNRNEKNLYCLDCRGEALCSGCTAQHRDHHVVQIRRSSYHDVVRVSELQKVLDLAGVQTYIINSAKVVFLNARPQPRHAKGVTKTCEICDRSLLDTNRYCSLGCKLTGIRIHNDMTFNLTPKNEQQVHQQEVVNKSAPAPPVQDETMEDHHLAPAVPTRSSLTSEDVVSASNSGSVRSGTSNSRKRSSGSSSSKRTRSSRKASSKSKGSNVSEDDDMDQDHHPQQSPVQVDVIDHESHHDQVLQEAADHEPHRESPPAKSTSPSLPALEDISLTTSMVQKSLGTLKLGRRSSPLKAASYTLTGDTHSTMEELSSSPTAASCCSLTVAGGGLGTEFSPSTPPPTRTSKRRKGTPHRAPFGM